jgi:ubiquinone/menaquinone biosynthesis C-methylase UbiE
MATVFMKWLEKNPRDYDRGIRWLTLGRLRPLKETIARRYVHAGSHILEIGCGTGELAAMMARSGGIVTGIDASPAMLAAAETKLAAAGLGDRITLAQMDAAVAGERFPPGSFDLIVSTLVFSELGLPEQRQVLRACAGLLAPGGRLLIADEVLPCRTLPRWAYRIVRLPLALLTWIATRATTRALSDFNTVLGEAGFRAGIDASFLGGSLVLFSAVPGDRALPEKAAAPPEPARLRRRVTLRTILIDLWALFFRIIPPYPKVRPGLYAVGRPGPDSPVLVTGNFDLTVRRLAGAIDGRADAWVLVADSAGINVWCAAGGGYFTADKVIAAVKTSGVEKTVNHRALILPQLCANGVDGWRIRRETGWGVHWGPVRAADIPAYLAAGRVKTDAMRRVRFPLKDRLEMVSVTIGFYGLLILVPVFFLWRSSFLPIAAGLLGLSYFYAVVHPWLPGRDGLQKSIPLILISLAGLLAYRALSGGMPTPQLFHWTVGVTGLSFFTAAELQGMSPLMRGEQANWIWEGVIGLALFAAYHLIPLAAGWS